MSEENMKTNKDCHAEGSTYCICLVYQEILWHESLRNTGPFSRNLTSLRWKQSCIHFLNLKNLYLLHKGRISKKFYPLGPLKA